VGVRPHGAPGCVLAWSDTTASNTCVGGNIYEAPGLDLTLPVKDVPRIMSNSNELTTYHGASYVSVQPAGATPKRGVAIFERSLFRLPQFGNLRLSVCNIISSAFTRVTLGEVQISG
jgi:hypothetical protein